MSLKELRSEIRQDLADIHYALGPDYINLVYGVLFTVLGAGVVISATGVLVCLGVITGPTWLVNL